MVNIGLEWLEETVALDRTEMTMTLGSQLPAVIATAAVAVAAAFDDLKITMSTDLKNKSVRRLRHSVTLIDWRQRLLMLNHLPLFWVTVICVHWNDDR